MPQNVWHKGKSLYNIGIKCKQKLKILKKLQPENKRLDEVERRLVTLIENHVKNRTYPFRLQLLKSWV